MSETAKNESPGADLAEAKRLLPYVSHDEQSAFAQRQYRARLRMARLETFYCENSCDVAHLHLLAAAAIMLGRFAGYSASYDEIGEMLMPMKEDGTPRGKAWSAYAVACRSRRAISFRNELWLCAHVADLERVRDRGLLEQFDAEVAAHPEDPTWRLLRDHMEITIGVRTLDNAAMTGEIAYETAMAQCMKQALLRFVTTGGALAWKYTSAAIVAVLTPETFVQSGLCSYRRAAFILARQAFYAWHALSVYRRGVRQAERGVEQPGKCWSLRPVFEEALGKEVLRMHPHVLTFFENMHEFQLKASVSLSTRLMRWGARAATLLLGQGFYECDMHQVDARARVFRRADGSLHFLREFFFGEAVRVFDSDFVVRQIRGRATLMEVFVDLHVAVEMQTTITQNGSVLMTARRFYFWRIPVPTGPFHMSFETRAVISERGEEIVEVDGRMEVEPRTRIERFVFQKILRWPKYLGGFLYQAKRKDAALTTAAHFETITEGVAV